jgi:hypothetical protein
MRSAAAARALAAGFLACAAAPAAPQNDLSTRAMVERVTTYVSDYQQKLTSVVADEDYKQDIVDQTPLESSMPRARRLRSEVFFVFEAVGRQWMAIRDTILVDDVPIRDRLSARAALETMPPAEVRRRFAQMNAHWNIGRIIRNFNEPTLGLLIFDREHQPRFGFDRRSVVRVRDTILITLAFRERDRPTLIRDERDGPAYSRGEVVADASGVIRRTALRLSLKDTKVELTTEYAFDEKLGMWVPSVFRERYERGREGSKEFERIACEAVYSNYRRFDVLTRIKNP